MPFENEDYVKMLFVDNLLITMLVIFVLVYIYYNFEILNSDNCYLNGDFKNPILITAVITLISLLVIGDKYESKVGGTDIDIIKKEPTTYTIYKNPVQPIEIIQKMKPIIPVNDAPIIRPSIMIEKPPGIDFISPAKGGNKSYQLKQNDIFIPHANKTMYMDVNV